MEKAFLAVVVALFGISLAHAQTDVLIEIDRGRTEGFFTKAPVFQRAILAKPAKPTDMAVLFLWEFGVRSCVDTCWNLLGECMIARPDPVTLGVPPPIK